MTNNATSNLQHLGIRFGDNDFYYTFIGILNTLKNAVLKGHTAVPTNKKQLTTIINNMSVGHYLSHQNQFRHAGRFGDFNNHIEHLRSYLKIKPEQVFINEEVVDFLKKNDWDNGEFFYITHIRGSEPSIINSR